jgi:hypothetical protein
MPLHPWPTRACIAYVVLVFLSWAAAFGADWTWGLAKLVVVLGLPWSLLVAGADATALNLVLLFAAGILNAGVLYALVRLLRRSKQGAARGSAAA